MLNNGELYKPPTPNPETNAEPTNAPPNASSPASAARTHRDAANGNGQAGGRTLKRIFLPGLVADRRGEGYVAWAGAARSGASRARCGEPPARLRVAADVCAVRAHEDLGRAVRRSSRRRAPVGGSAAAVGTGAPRRDRASARRRPGRVRGRARRWARRSTSSRCASLARPAIRSSGSARSPRTAAPSWTRTPRGASA